MKPVRVLLVDDSATMRALLRHAISKDPGLTVVGEASDTVDAREKIKLLDPDVVTLDVEMPGMNGLEFLEKIMRLRPTPVVMISNHTAPGAAATIAALEIGAFECIPKPGGAMGDTFALLPDLLRQAAAAKHQISSSRAGQGARPSNGVGERRADWPELIAIGSSTGGVEALLTVMADFPADCPPTLIVQHMPANFTAPFAARLDRASKATVTEARNGDTLQPGHVYVARGGTHLTLNRNTCLFVDGETVSGHKPSVDVLFGSVADKFKGRAAGVILTGMGRDGAEGMLRMRRAGARTLAQDEATSLVYGMPRVAHEIGAAEKQVPLGKIAREIFG